MRCPACKHENPEGVKFCGECGTKLERLCPRCGTANPPVNKFCYQCGENFASLAGWESRFAFPATYTPQHLTEKILTSRTALEGERKQVTVLFADLKGSTELIAGLDPEEARKLLDPALHAMMDAVHRYEGTVNQVLGDGIMALFGAPVAHEDHAARACYAALAMQAGMRRYAEEVRRSRGIEVQSRVGLNSGEVVVRAIGNDLHMDYSAVGQTTHLAARMEQLATPGSIRLTAATLRLVEGLVRVNSLGPIPVKGLADPVEVFELIGATPFRGRFQATAAGGLTSFVGRQTEIEALNQALERARGGRGQIVALVGEPGVGKSRLVWEFTHSHRTYGWLILESSSVSYGKAIPYHPVIDLLKAYFHIEAGDDGRKIREKLTGKLVTVDRGFETILPALLSLLEVSVEDAHWQTLDPPQRRQRTLEAVEHLLLWESQVHPLLLVLEDLHWIDTETQGVLDSLIQRLPTARILLIVSYRPEYQHGWGSKTYYTQVHLDPLPPEGAEELLQTLLGDDAGLLPVKQLLIERTEGNPFFLEESVRTLVETGVLVGERGAYHVAKALQHIQVPGTVQAILAARIDRLPPDEKRLLQSASVIGKDVHLPLLAAIAEMPEEALRHGIVHLQAAEFLYETSLFPELKYTFKHALTHEVAYGSLLQDRRRALHTQIVEAVERLHSNRLADQVERLAYHASRGEVWEKALSYLRQAGVKAAERSANQQAVAYFEQALVALKHLPESRETQEQAIDIRFDLRSSLLPLGELGRMAHYLREAETLAGVLGDRGRLGHVSAYMSAYFWWMGDYDRAVESGQRALAIATALGDFALQVMANFYLGLAYYALGDFRRALDFVGRNVASLEGHLSRERFGQATFSSVTSRTTLVLSLAELGEFAEGIVRGEEAVAIAESIDHAHTLTYAYCGLGSLYLRKGDAGKAISMLERGLILCEVAEISILSPIIAAQLGWANALSGRLGVALPLVEQAASAKTIFGKSLTLTFLSETYLLGGRIDDATQAAVRALDLSRESKERGIQTWTLRLLGEIASHEDPPDVDKAEASYGEAIAVAEELGMRPLVAHCHLGLGKLYTRIGTRRRAEEHLTTATTLFREMDMGFWIEQAEAELKQLG